MRAQCAMEMCCVWTSRCAEMSSCRSSEAALALALHVQTSGQILEDLRAHGMVRDTRLDAGNVRSHATIHAGDQCGALDTCRARCRFRGALRGAARGTLRTADASRARRRSRSAPSETARARHAARSALSACAWESTCAAPCRAPLAGRCRGRSFPALGCPKHVAVGYHLPAGAAGVGRRAAAITRWIQAAVVGNTVAGIERSIGVHRSAATILTFLFAADDLAFAGSGVGVVRRPAAPRVSAGGRSALLRARTAARRVVRVRSASATLAFADAMHVRRRARRAAGPVVAILR